MSCKSRFRTALSLPAIGKCNKHTHSLLKPMCPKYPLMTANLFNDKHTIFG